jgi:lipoprotein-anchoring transpeptidase ErfK/SrfK
MISRRKLIAALGASLLPSVAHAATSTAPPPPEKSKPVAKAPAKPAAAKKPPVKKPAAKKQVAKKKAPPPPPRLIITINKVSQKMTVELDGDTLYKWPVSTGAPGYETPSGTYRPFRLEKEHYSKEWDDAPMPYSIFFTGRGHAVHGSYHVKSLGRRASHGCVRLHPDNAAKLFSLVSKTGMSNTRVIVRGGFFDGGQISEMLDEEKKRFKKAGSFMNSLPD